jgi:hypothetical protein
MRPVHQELAEPVARGLLGAATVDGGPTDEQLGIIGALLHGYFDVDTDVGSLEPLDPSGLAAAVTDPKARHRVVQLMIVLEFSRHPGSDAMAKQVEDYAAALDVDEKMQVVARDALHAARAELNADYQRYHEDYDVEKQFAGTEDADMAARLRALEHCPPGSLGRAYFDFYQRWGLKFPGEPGGGDVIFVAHDFTHVLSGYEPDGPGELSLQAMLVSATDGDHHFSTFCASLRSTRRGCSTRASASRPRSERSRGRARQRSSPTPSAAAPSARATSRRSTISRAPTSSSRTSAATSRSRRARPDAQVEAPSRYRSRNSRL